MADEGELDEWLRQSTAASGVPEKIEDRDVLLSVVNLLLAPMPSTQFRSWSCQSSTGGSAA